jgi:hypothetical protein
MSQLNGVRWGWLKLMYILTVITAGAFGLGMILIPGRFKSMFNESCDPVNYGILGSVYLAFGLLALLGLRAPLKFAPVLLLQLTYKSAWFMGVFLPLILRGGFSSDMLMTVVIFALTIIGDLIAIPFPYIFSKQLNA